jgi:hypothetical protein
MTRVARRRIINMSMTEQQRKLIKGRVVLALHEVLQRKPTRGEIERYFRAAQVLYTTLRPDLYGDKRHRSTLSQP